MTTATPLTARTEYQGRLLWAGPCHPISVNEIGDPMAFQIKRKGPVGAAVHARDSFDGALRLARGFMDESEPKLKTSITNLKTGETMSEAEIEEAALSLRPARSTVNSG